MELTHLSLFSGIGGLDLSAEWAGFKTVGQCEWADYPTKVLEKHWPDVPRWRDIKTLTKESFYEKTKLKTVDVISGGCPCQPFSVAGKRRGTEDDRYLWPEMYRVITELVPKWVVFENVPGIKNMALDTVLFDLEEAGYAAETLIIPACGVNAWHKRERVCVVAYANNRSRTMLRNREFQTTSKTSREGIDNGLRTKTIISGKRWENKSRLDRMAARLRKSLDWPNTDSDSERLQGSAQRQICRGGGYRSNLVELVETSPAGVIGRLNPTWTEWLTGYPIGWTDLNA